MTRFGLLLVAPLACAPAPIVAGPGPGEPPASRMIEPGAAGAGFTGPILVGEPSPCPSSATPGEPPVEGWRGWGGRVSFEFNGGCYLVVPILGAESVSGVGSSVIVGLSSVDGQPHP
ncbi:MAG: hypothetical protein D6693_10855 [Planctomycetota bacterium]|nr:MAG: hypothetical protein D6693_10855 [Planctomycetota bacterium]